MRDQVARTSPALPGLEISSWAAGVRSPEYFSASPTRANAIHFKLEFFCALVYGVVQPSRPTKSDDSSADDDSHGGGKDNRPEWSSNDPRSPDGGKGLQREMYLRRKATVLSELLSSFMKVTADRIQEHQCV